MGVKIHQEPFGRTLEGAEIVKYTLENSHGIKVSIVSYGSSIQSIIVPDKNGHFDDIALGYDCVKNYEDDKCYIGALCGRVANRVSNARVTIDGVTSNLSKNDGENHIHGGFKGFNKKVFASKVTENGLEMMVTSPNGDEGYPGTMTVIAIYNLTDDNELIIRITAVCTRPSPINLVQHTYFNLAGHKAENIYDHSVIINAQKFTPKKENGYPTGEIVPVKGTLFDFTRGGRKLGEDIDEVPDDIGFDHNYCLDEVEEFVSHLAARLEHAGSGRVVEVRTNQPGLQLYTANYCDGEPGKEGASYRKHGSVCLEAQNYPDAINQPAFPNAVVRPEKGYYQEIIYKFTTL